MRNQLLKTLLLAGILLGLPLVASGNWAAIPAEAWALKAGDPKAAKGAVVLEERLRLASYELEYWYRVRIVNDAGKGAAEFSDFPSRFMVLEGRVVYPDGKEVAFNSQKDFKSRTTTVGGSQRKRTLLIPPGITSDCILDLHYKEQMDWSNIGHWERRLMGSYPIERFRLDLARGFGLAWTIMGMSSDRSSVVEAADGKTIVFKDLPARPDAPFVLESALDLPTLVAYNIHPGLHEAASKGADAYWKRFAEVFKDIFTIHVSKGWSYSGFAKEMLADLPKPPQEALQTLLNRVHGRILNVQRLSWEEAEERKKKNVGDRRVDPYDLSEMIKRGEGNDWGLLILVYRLATDAGLCPKMLCVADRDLRLFRYKTMDWNQFTGFLLGVDDFGKETLWVDPAQRLMPPGMMNPDYQGTPALVLHTTGWTAEKTMIMAQPETNNLQEFNYGLSLSPEQLGFQLQASFTGQPAFARRSDVYREEPKERDRSLKESFEGRLKGWAITEAKLEEAVNPRKPLLWTVKGNLEQEGERRMKVWPFPGMGSPLYLPDVWPERRSEKIVLPYRKIHRAKSTLKVPKGYVVRAVSPMDERNLFGTVQWKQTTKALESGTEVSVEMEVQVKVLSASSEDYALFREYMGWINEAMNRTVLVEKES